MTTLVQDVVQEEVPLTIGVSMLAASAIWTPSKPTSPASKKKAVLLKSLRTPELNNTNSLQHETDSPPRIREALLVAVLVLRFAYVTIFKPKKKAPQKPSAPVIDDQQPPNTTIEP